MICFTFESIWILLRWDGGTLTAGGKVGPWHRRSRDWNRMRRRRNFVHNAGACVVCRTYYTSVKTHKMSFSARPLIQMNLLWVWKGGLKCTFLAWKIFFAKYRYFIIYRQKTDFLRMCSMSDILHIRKNTQKSKFNISKFIMINNITIRHLFIG